MPDRKQLEEALRNAADALRAAAGAEGEARERDPDHRGCLDSSQALRRLGEALRAAAEIVCEAGAEPCERPEGAHPAHAPAPMPPYPPFPPYPAYAPYAPYPPYPPYPPIVVLGGRCTCQQMAPAGITPAAPAPVQAAAATPAPAAALAAALPAAAAAPAAASLQDVEALLDVGESAAALVKRTLSHRPEGSRP